MKHLVNHAFLFCLFTTLPLAFADQRFSGLPFEPVRAADLPVVSSDTLSLESEQWQSLARWRSVEQQLSTAKETETLRKKDLDRDEVLARSGRISQDRLAFTRLRYETSVGSTAQLAAALDQARAQAEMAKLKLIEKGNPQVDLRYSLAEAQVRVLEFQRQSLVSSERSAEAMLIYFQRQSENGGVLLKKAVISDVEMERRQNEFSRARDSLHGVRMQLDATEESIKGAKSVVERLSKM